MTVDRAAAASLTEIDRVERRTREALYYAGSSTILLLWGVSWVLGYAITHFSPGNAQTAWYVIQTLGIAASVVIGRVRSHAQRRDWDWRLSWAFVVLMGFGFLWQWLLGNGQ